MAGTAERTLALKIIADINGLKPAQKGLGSFTKSLVSWGKAFTGALVINGIERLADAALDGVKAFRKERAIVQSFRQTVKNLGLPVRAATSAMDDMAQRALNLGFDDAQTIQGLNQFLKLTGNVADATKVMGLAQDIARSQNIDLAAAMKIAAGIYKGSERVLKNYGLAGVEGMEAVSKAAAKERNQARQWARNHPFEVQLGKIGDTFADVVGSFATGDFKGVQAGIAKLGKHIHNALFGFTRKDGTQVEGLVGKLGAWGRSMADGIIKGIGETDWGAKLGEILNAAAGAVSTAASNGTLANIGILGGVVAATIFAVDMFITAAANMFRAPKWIANKLLTAAIGVAAGAAGLAFSAAMFASSLFVGAAAAVLRAIATAPLVLAAAGRLGSALGIALRTPMLAALGPIGLAIMTGLTIDQFLTSIGWGPDANRGPTFATNPDGSIKRLPKDPAKRGREGKGFASGTSNAPRGWHWVGEKGPELMRFRGGEQVMSNRASMAAGSNNYSISVHVAPGGDLVETGRQVVRAIQEYEKRGGRTWRTA
jgi:hypothetical protein